MRVTARSRSPRITETRQCPKCGAELSADAAQGLCPKCLFDVGLESQPAGAAGVARTGRSLRRVRQRLRQFLLPARFPTPYLEALARQFPQLDSFEHLGQGGMGVVYNSAAAAARPNRRREASPAVRRRRTGLRRAFHPRGTGAGPAQPPQHRAGLRFWPDR
jgi:hypothetical protein